MEANTNNSKQKYFHYNLYGNRLTICKSKSGKINFTLYHDKIVEGIARKDFEDLSLNITADSGMLFKFTQGLYDIVGDKFISS